MYTSKNGLQKNAVVAYSEVEKKNLSSIVV